MGGHLGIPRKWIRYSLVLIVLLLVVIGTVTIPGTASEEEIPDIALVMKSLDRKSVV